MLETGQIRTLEVAREAAFGYFLSDGETDVLLHKNETEGVLREGQEIEVFLYMDNQERLAATMHQPLLQMGQFDWLKVTDVNKRMGVFLDMGIQKELLLSKDDLPFNWAQWPQVGDRVFVGLKHDRRGRLLAKLGLDVELAEHEKQGTRDLINTEVSGNVYRVIEPGAFLFTDENYIAFIHREDMNGTIRLGEFVTARVKSIRDDGRINVTHQASKKEAYYDDSESILQILQDRGGAMPFTDKTSPETIRERFGISKAAFKRAMGKLLKERKVYQEEGWTYLTSMKQ
ncbi:hypothetical protein BEP19_09655 [Ammoniphilus oxalaticus]|uniref:S1 motif domain-containing protein n=1 Tax=Ammoniphilus oxalaticus TaxID=66863 RepID=A0A419SL04_9BACL|nr:S1-like domain-containing RNA-binding protein [Ammoniphilus oxalaticus]RKD24629.1 hypothetical protein BEP19_09655 [Ammoniphilus oxalaticus]